MTETVIDTSIGASNTATGECTKEGRSDNLVLEVTSFDSNSTSLDFSVSGGAGQTTRTTRPMNGGPSDVTGVDASSSGVTVVFSGLEGVEHVEITVTNQASSGTTITVEEATGY